LITLILADDHPVFASGLRAVFDAEPDMTVVSVSASGRDAVRAAIEHRPDVAVLDITMPDGDGLWVCGQLRAAALATRVLMLTMSDDEENVLAALRAGAYGYTLKGAGPDEIVAGFVQWPAARRFSVPGSRLECCNISAARRPRRLFPSSPSARPRCWRCWPRGKTTPPSRIAWESVRRPCATTFPTSLPSCMSPTDLEPSSGRATPAWVDPARAEAVYSEEDPWMSAGLVINGVRAPGGRPAYRGWSRPWTARSHRLQLRHRRAWNSACR
jgi:CheY-like chemotaxis protein